MIVGNGMGTTGAAAGWVTAAAAGAGGGGVAVGDWTSAVESSRPRFFTLDVFTAVDCFAVSSITSMSDKGANREADKSAEDEKLPDLRLRFAAGGGGVLTGVAGEAAP